MALDEATVFQEAMNAIDAGDATRARDLLTRLIKINPDNADYWLWMSAVVESPRERVFCLKEVLRVDASNVSARRGLILLGALPPDESLAIPFQFQKRDWQSQLRRFSLVDEFILSGTWQIALFGLVTVFVVVVATIWMVAAMQGRPSPLAQMMASPLSENSLTNLDGLDDGVLLPTLAGPTPLVYYLKVTYTPTPLYVQTQHPRTEYFRNAMLAYKNEDWDGMLRYLQAAAREEPDSPDIVYYMGEAYRFKGDYTKAYRAYADALFKAADFAPAYLGRGRARIEENPQNWQAARSDFGKAISYDPNLGEAYLELGILYVQRKSYSLAAENLEQALNLMPDSAVVYYSMAQLALQEMDFEKTVAFAARALELDSTFLPCYRLSGESLFRMNQLREALTPLRLYTQYDLKDDEAWTWLGTCYAEYGATAEALAAFSTAIKANPQSYEAYFQRGLIFLERNNPEQAANDFAAALKVKENTYLINLSMGKAQMAQEKYGPASYYFDRAIAFVESDAEKAELYYWRAQSMQGLGEVSAEVRDWSAMLELPADSVPGAWAEMAQERLQAMATPTFTPASHTPSSTFRPTLTITITSTRKPTLTLTSSPTRRPTLTGTQLSTSIPGKTQLPKMTATPAP